jgi:cystathionine beta-lyase/cystathionine gamma-synthase
MRFETAAIHAGQDPETATGAAIVPIYQTSTFVQEAVAKHKGFEYSRTDNPTRRALETCLAALEEAEFATAYASGMAAITTLSLTLKSGQKVVFSDDVYGGTYRLYSKVLADLGVEWASADMGDRDAVKRALGGEAGLLVAESPTNPMLKVVDLEMLAELSHEAGALFAVDNTFATPFIQKPLEFGADVVIYSATKYLGGHSDLVMGALVTSDAELATRLRFLQNSIGAVPSPFDSWLLMRGLKTLALRMAAHSYGAQRVAQWLLKRSDVTKVYFPGLSDFPGHDLAKRQMAACGEPLYGGMVAFEAESEEKALAICERTKLFFLGESLGGVESLIEHPAQMTHASLEGSGLEVPRALVRLSVGIEHPDDLIADLEQAFA